MLTSLLNRAVFLDKDGTLVENVPYNVDPTKIRFTTRAVDGLLLLHAAGYKLIVVSNQSGIARGYFPEEALQAVEANLRDQLAREGIPLTGFYYCPHHPEGRVAPYAVNCFCRKPRPGMIFLAAREHGLHLVNSWLVGDILDDIEAGRRADCRTILLDNGNETQWLMFPLRRPHYTVTDLFEAAQRIIQNDTVATLQKRMASQELPSQPGASDSRSSIPEVSGTAT